MCEGHKQAEGLQQSNEKNNKLLSNELKKKQTHKEITEARTQATKQK